MKNTYERAMKQVFEDEGGYTNDAADPGGPTNWGITIEDARMYWKTNATAEDVKNMPKSVAEDIYRKHYADPIHYDELPAGVDYSVLDYGINSGISRSIKVLQRLVNVPADGKMGPSTLSAVNAKNPKELINAIYDERLSFLQSLSTWGTFGRGWGSRCKRGRALALSMASNVPSPAVIVATGAGAAGAAIGHSYPHLWYWAIGLGAVASIAIIFLLYKWIKKYVNSNNSVVSVDVPKTTVPRT